jgi:hypothetical protein
MTAGLHIDKEEMLFGYINVRLLGHESEVESDDSDDGMAKIMDSIEVET